MLKLTPGANKANAILIRIVLFLIGGIAIITGMCLFSGDMWMLTPRAEQYQPATGDLVDVVIYEPSKFFFALLYVFIITGCGCWRYVKSHGGRYSILYYR